jgi:hypothetical protein
MNMTTTKDGYKVTNIAQHGEMTGHETKCVTIFRPHGYDWWETNSIDEARIFVDNAQMYTRAELIEALELKDLPNSLDLEAMHI